MVFKIAFKCAYKYAVKIERSFDIIYINRTF